VGKKDYTMKAYKNLLEKVKEQRSEAEKEAGKELPDFVETHEKELWSKAHKPPPATGK
jgi:hypothetical protein